MKAVWFLALAAMACAPVNVAENAGVDRTVKITTVARGGYASHESDRKAVLATNDADYRKRWEELIGGGDVPNVDFDSGVAVFLFAGMRNTGGWSIQPNSATVEVDGTAVIDAKVQGPPPGGIVTQAITYPYAVVVVSSRDVKKVRWPE